MRIRLLVALLAALLLTTVATPATGSVAADGGGPEYAGKSDNRVHPLGEEKAALTE